MVSLSYAIELSSSWEYGSLSFNWQSPRDRFCFLVEFNRQLENLVFQSGIPTIQFSNFGDIENLNEFAIPKNICTIEIHNNFNFFFTIYDIAASFSNISRYLIR